MDIATFVIEDMVDRYVSLVDRFGPQGVCPIDEARQHRLVDGGLGAYVPSKLDKLRGRIGQSPANVALLVDFGLEDSGLADFMRVSWPSLVGRVSGGDSYEGLAIPGVVRDSMGEKDKALVCLYTGQRNTRNAELFCREAYSGLGPRLRVVVLDSGSADDDFAEPLWRSFVKECCDFFFPPDPFTEFWRWRDDRAREAYEGTYSDAERQRIEEKGGLEEAHGNCLHNWIQKHPHTEEDLVPGLDLLGAGLSDYVPYEGNSQGAFRELMKRLTLAGRHHVFASAAYVYALSAWRSVNPGLQWAQVVSEGGGQSFCIPPDVLNCEKKVSPQQDFKDLKDTLKSYYRMCQEIFTPVEIGGEVSSVERIQLIPDAAGREDGVEGLIFRIRFFSMFQARNGGGGVPLATKIRKFTCDNGAFPGGAAGAMLRCWLDLYTRSSDEGGNSFLGPQENDWHFSMVKDGNDCEVGFYA